MPHIHTPECADECIQRWMVEHRRKRLVRTITAQIGKARRRGFRKTQVALEDLEALLS